MTREEKDFIVSSACENAITTVYVEKAQPVEQLSSLAAGSVQDVCEARSIRFTEKQLQQLRKRAAKQVWGYSI